MLYIQTWQHLSLISEECFRTRKFHLIVQFMDSVCRISSGQDASHTKNTEYYLSILLTVGCVDIQHNNIPIPHWSATCRAVSRELVSVKSAFIHTDSATSQSYDILVYYASVHPKIRTIFWNFKNQWYGKCGTCFSEVKFRPDRVSGH